MGSVLVKDGLIDVVWVVSRHFSNERFISHSV